MNRLLWKQQLIANLQAAGPVSRRLARYALDHRVRIWFWKQDRTGGIWLPGNIIVLSTNSYSAGMPPDNPYLLRVVAHEVRHLEQGLLTAPTVYGELDAWQVEHRVNRELLGDPHASLGAAWDELAELPLCYSRPHLRYARRLMKRVSPAYPIYGWPLLPLTPRAWWEAGRGDRVTR